MEQGKIEEMALNWLGKAGRTLALAEAVRVDLDVVNGLLRELREGKATLGGDRPGLSREMAGWITDIEKILNQQGEKS